MLLVHNSYQLVGGEDFAFENEVHLLRSHGHEVATYVRSNAELEGTSRVSAAMGAVWSRRSLNELTRLIAATRPEVVHFHNTFPLVSPSGIYAAKRLNVPVVLTLHNYRLTCAAATHFREGHVCLDCMGKVVPWPAVAHSCYREDRAASTVVSGMQLVHRLAGTWNRRVDAFIILSEVMRGVLESGGLPSEKLHIKVNFLPDPGAGQGPRERALFVGRLTPEKGLHTLLTAWGKLPDLPLDIIGSGPLEREVLRAVEERGLHNVRLIGQMGHAEVLTAMKRARLLIVPSLAYEGLPMTIIEAFACGTPVIASDIGSSAEMVGAHQAGALFSPADWEGLARLVRDLWGDEDKLDRFRQLGRQEYARAYGPDRNYESLMKIYDSLRRA